LLFLGSIMKQSLFLTGLCSLILAGCGGGGSGGSSGGGNGSGTGTQLPSAFYASGITWDQIAVTSNTTSTPIAQFVGGNEYIPTTLGCYVAAANYPVKETSNVIVYSDSGVADADLTRVARFAEASLLTLRSRYSFSSGTGFSGSKLKVCVSTGTSGNAEASYNTMQVASQGQTEYLQASTIHHEMTHIAQAQALGCSANAPAYEKWLLEGMALHVSGMDLPAKSSLGSLQTTVTSYGISTPFDWIDGGMAPVSVYPSFRLAFDAFLGVKGKTDIDVMNFLKSYGSSTAVKSDGETNGCPGVAVPGTNGGRQPYAGNGWKTEFDAYFSTDLRGTGALGTTFWTTAPTYAQ
jgi:hypothetical protein